MTPLGGWQNFYVIVGSSAGALIGLQFVVMALVADLPRTPSQAQAGHAFATPNIVHFGAVLFLAAALCAPWHGIGAAAVCWGLLGLGGVAYALIVARRLRVQTVYRPVFEDWLFHALLPLAAYATLATSACVASAHTRGAMFGVVPKTIWAKLNPADDNNLCNWAMRCLLVEDGNRLILIDNGMGSKQSDKFFGYYYLNGTDTLEKSLAKHGFAKEDITDVFLTHLHFDHCGGSIESAGGVLFPAFKNAVYWSNERHWQWATQPNDREKASFLKENILPIQESGQLRFIDTRPFLSFSDTIKVRFVSGHTESMMLPQIQYKNKTVVFMADLLPSAAHIPVPYVMAYDTRPLVTLTEKKEFLTEAQNNDYILFFEHDPTIECCTLQLTERGIRMKDTFLLENIS